MLLKEVVSGVIAIGYLTWTLIASLTVAFSGTLGTSFWYAHKAQCLERANQFMQRQMEQKDFQGPVNACE